MRRQPRFRPVSHAALLVALLAAGAGPALADPPLTPGYNRDGTPKRSYSDTTRESDLLSAEERRRALPRTPDGQSIPPTLRELEAKGQRRDKERDQALRAVDLRRDAQREAALSYGARAGLAARYLEIRQILDTQALALDRIYQFRALLIRGPSGVLIEPPIVGTAEDALTLANEGQSAGLTDRILKINERARIVTAPRSWRQYLERDWGEVEPPPDLLLPEKDEEERTWKRWVREGWEEGRRQADLVFQEDLARLNRDFQGMVRYRELLAQNIITAPFARAEDRGIVSSADEMRVGDREVQITGPARFTPPDWSPAVRDTSRIIVP